MVRVRVRVRLRVRVRVRVRLRVRVGVRVRVRVRVTLRVAEAHLGEAIARVERHKLRCEQRGLHLEVGGDAGQRLHREVPSALAPLVEVRAHAYRDLHFGRTPVVEGARVLRVRVRGRVKVRVRVKVRARARGRARVRVRVAPVVERARILSAGRQPSELAEAAAQAGGAVHVRVRPCARGPLDEGEARRARTQPHLG